MPRIRIPRSEPGGGSPPFSVSIDASTADARALGGVGAEIAGLGQELARQVGEERKDQDELDLFRERGRATISLDAGLKGLSQELLQFSESDQYSPARYKALRDQRVEAIYGKTLEPVQNEKLRAQLEGELQGHLDADLSTAFRSIEIDRAAISLEEHEAELNARFPTFETGQAWRQLGLYGQRVEALSKQFRELRGEGDKSLERVAGSFKSAMLARAGGEASYYRALLDKVHLQGDGKFPPNNLFIRDRAQSRSKLTGELVRDLETQVRDGYTTPTFDRRSQTYDGQDPPSVPSLMGIDDYTDTRVQGALGVMDGQVQRLNSVVDYFKDGTDIPNLDSTEMQAAFSRAYADVFLPKITDPSRSDDAKLDDTLALFRDFPTVPGAHANTFRKVITSARGAADAQAIDFRVLDTFVNAYTIGSGNAALVRELPSSMQEDFRQQIGIASTKLADVLKDTDEVSFIRDYTNARSSGLDGVAAVDAARNAASGRRKIREKGVGDKALLATLGQPTSGKDAVTVRQLAETNLKETLGTSPLWKDVQLTDLEIDKYRTFLEKAIGETDDMNDAIARANADFMASNPVFDFFGRSVISRDIREISQGRDPRLIETEIILSVPNHRRALEDEADRLMKEARKLGDEGAPLRERANEFLEGAKRFADLESRLNKGRFLKRIRVDKLATSDTVGQITIGSLVEDGELILEAGVRPGPIIDPFTGLPWQIDFDYESSEAKTLDGIEGALRSALDLELKDKTLAQTIVGAEKDQDIIEQARRASAKLDRAWTMTTEEFTKAFLVTQTSQVDPGSFTQPDVVQERRIAERVKLSEHVRGILQPPTDRPLIPVEDIAEASVEDWMFMRNRALRVEFFRARRAAQEKFRAAQTTGQRRGLPISFFNEDGLRAVNDKIKRAADKSLTEKFSNLLSGELNASR